MKRTYFCCLFLCLTSTFSLAQSPTPLIHPNMRVASPISAQKDPKAQGKILDSYGKLPLRFEANHGQTDAQVKFLSRTSGYSLFLTGDEAVLTLSGKNPQGFVSGHRFSDAASGSRKGVPAAADPTTGNVLRMKLRNANSAARVTGVDELAGTSNYFIGNDPAKWRTNVPTYAKVKYEEIYSGIDLVYYGNQRQLEYDFIVAPGADPHRIAFDVRGAKRIRQDGRGELVFKVGADEIRWHRPVVYQEKDGARQSVAARYVISDMNRVGFEVARYDASRPLYIDPLIYSTYLGGSGDDQGFGIAVDSSGNAYVTGFTTSTDFPTKNPLQTAKALGKDVFVTKINAAGSALVYSTYLGGSGDDFGYGIAVDSSGNAYVTGYTTSTDFPTMNPLQPASGGGQDAFVSKINAAGSALVYSTYLGGSGDEWGNGIAVDAAGNAYVTGFTRGTDFPTMNPLQPASGGGVDAFVSKINPSGSEFVYSTYLGGSNNDEGQGIAVDSGGNAYVTGLTDSTDFPAVNPLQGTSTGSNAFLSKFNATGSALIYSTYLVFGKQNTSGAAIAVDSAGAAYITGDITGYQSTAGVVFKVNPSGSALDYSAALVFSGIKYVSGLSIAVDSAGSAYVAGSAAYGHNNKILLARLNSDASQLIYSTYEFGGAGASAGRGIALDSAGKAYVTGATTSTNFPTKNPLQPANAGGFGGDAFVSKIDMRMATTTTLTSSPNPSTYGQAVTFTAVVRSRVPTLPVPDGETVTFKGTKIWGTGTLSGGSASFTTSTLPAPGSYINAVYGGDSIFRGSTSNVKQVVNQATTTTTEVSSLNPSKVGQSVTFTASMTPQFGGTIKGTVTFSDGTTALKTVSVSGGVAKFTTSTLAAGTHTITGTYNGSANFTGSSGSLTQQVN